MIFCTVVVVVFIRLQLLRFSVTGHFLDSLLFRKLALKLLSSEALFSVYNAPNVICRPVSSWTRCVSLSAPQIPHSHCRGGIAEGRDNGRVERGGAERREGDGKAAPPQKLSKVGVYGLAIMKQLRPIVAYSRT